MGDWYRVALSHQEIEAGAYRRLFEQLKRGMAVASGSSEPSPFCVFEREVEDGGVEVLLTSAAARAVVLDGKAATPCSSPRSEEGHALLLYRDERCLALLE
jgi:hypothetical protein